MPVSMPDTQKSQGYSRLLVIDDTAADLTALTEADLTGPSTQWLTCHLYDDFVATVEESVGSGRRKMCARNVPQQFGEVTNSITDIAYSHLPQEDDVAPGNEARATLTPGATKIFVEFQGIEGKDDSIEDGQRYIAHRVDLGKQVWGRSQDDQFGEFAITQKVIYSDGGEPIHGVVDDES